jgi:hypothetical protein
MSQSTRMAAYMLTTTGVKFDAGALSGKDTDDPAESMLQAVVMAYQQQTQQRQPEAVRDLIVRLNEFLGGKSIKQVVSEQTEQVQQEAAKELARPFRRSIRRTAGAISRLLIQVDSNQAEFQAEQILNATFDEQAAKKELVEEAFHQLSIAFAIGAMSEFELMQTKATVSEIAERLVITIPAAIVSRFGSVPDWVRTRTRTMLNAVFAQPYWDGILQKTRDDIQEEVADGISKGWRLGRIGKAITAMAGAYALMRSTLVARTEVNNAIAAGHNAAIEKLSDDVGVSINKVWLAILDDVVRDAHASLDATQDVNGLFNLDGILIPWPGHYSLPVAQRANCRCRIISSVTEAQLQTLELVQGS